MVSALARVRTIAGACEAPACVVRLVAIEGAGLQGDGAASQGLA